MTGRDDQAAPVLQLWADWLEAACGKQDYLNAIDQAGFTRTAVVAEGPYKGPGMIPELEGKIVSLRLRLCK